MQCIIDKNNQRYMISCYLPILLAIFRSRVCGFIGLCALKLNNSNGDNGNLVAIPQRFTRRKKAFPATAVQSSISSFHWLFGKRIKIYLK